MDNVVNEFYSKEVNEIYSNSTFNPKTQQTSEANIKSCLKLAINVAKEYHRTSGTKLHLDDVIQHANLGLCIAAQRYNNPEVKFSAYAYHYIKKYVLDAINVIARPLAVSTVEGYTRVTDKLNFISKDAKFSMGDDDIEGDKNPIYNKLVSSTIAGDVLADLSSMHIRQVDTIHKFMTGLDYTEKLVICAIFGLRPFIEALSTKQISKKYKLTSTQINNAYHTGIDKIKSYCELHKVNAESLLTEASTISKHSHYVEDNQEYFELADNPIEISDYMKVIQEASNMTDMEMEIALFNDDNDSFAFFAIKNIFNLIVYKKYRISRRYNNGNVNVDVSYCIYDNNGNMLKDEVYQRTIKKVSIYTFGDFAKSQNIVQAHAPFYKKS